MSTKTEDVQKSQNQKEASQEAEANSQGTQDTQVTKPEDVLNQEAQTPEEKIGKLVGTLAKENPNLTPSQIGEITAVMLGKTKAMEPDTLAAQAAARLIPTTPEPDAGERVYLKADKKRQFPLHKSALDGYVVLQTQKRKVEGTDQVVSVAASHINAVGIYTKDEYDRFNVPETGAFARMKIDVTVIHKPGQKGNTQDADEVTEDTIEDILGEA